MSSLYPSFKNLFEPDGILLDLYVESVMSFITDFCINIQEEIRPIRNSTIIHCLKVSNSLSGPLSIHTKTIQKQDKSKGNQNKLKNTSKFNLVGMLARKNQRTFKLLKQQDRNILTIYVLIFQYLNLKTEKSFIKCK